MKRPKVLTLAVAALALLLVGVAGARWWQKRAVEQQIMLALQERNRLTLIQTMGELRKAHRIEVREVLLSALESPDPLLRGNAASQLPTIRQDLEIRDELISHLHTSPYRGVRLACAICLMSAEVPEVRQAYIQALKDPYEKDPYEKVVRIACMELGHRGGAAATAALLQVLGHPSWHARLEACKALITLKAADPRVVSTLEAMSREPEAAKYDAQIAMFRRMEAQSGLSEEFKGSWGTLGTILEQARHLATK